MRTATAWQAVGGRAKCGFAAKILSKHLCLGDLWLAEANSGGLQVFVMIPSAVIPSPHQQVLMFSLFRSLFWHLHVQRRRRRRDKFE